MKKLFLIVFAFAISTHSGFAQIEDRWEELADHLAQKAEQIAEQAERQAGRIEYFAEKNAAKWEAQAERMASRFENKWNNNWRSDRKKNAHGRFVFISPEGVFLGIEATDISGEKARKLGFENLYGSYISRVVKNSAAQQAGLQPFDYIYGVDNHRTDSDRDLTDILEEYQAGDEVTLHFIRKGQAMTAAVKLGSHEDHDWGHEGPEARGFFGISPLDEQGPEQANGVPVEVVEESTATEMGLQDGDIITQINGFPILDWEDVTTAISNTSPGNEIEVNFRRNGKDMQGKGTLKPHWDAFAPGGENWDFDFDINWDEMGDLDIQLDGDLDFGWDGQNEDRAFLGVYIDMVSEQKAQKLGFENPYGSYISGVMKNSAAEKAGIQPLDYIFGIDQYRVGENQNLGGILKKYKPGDKATVHYIRKGKKTTAPIIFSKPSDAEKTDRNSCQVPFLGIVHEGGDREMDGVKIKPVKNSTASDLGLQDGDIITHINGHKMVDWNDISAAIKMLDPGETIAVDFLRDGKKMKGSKPIMSYAEAKKCEKCDCGNMEKAIVRMDPPTKLEFRWKDEKAPADEVTKQRIDVSSARAAVENVTPAEESTLKSKGIHFPQNSTLTVEKLRISPDQSAGLFSLDFNVPSTGQTVVTIYNQAGRAIYEYDLGRFSGAFNDHVDISQNGPGSYFLQITQDEKVFTKKIVLTNQ